MTDMIIKRIGRIAALYGFERILEVTKSIN